MCGVARARIDANIQYSTEQEDTHNLYDPGIDKEERVKGEDVAKNRIKYMSENGFLACSVIFRKNIYNKNLFSWTVIIVCIKQKLGFVQQT